MSKNPAFMTYVGLSVMVALWLVMLAHWGGEFLYHPEQIEKQAYPLIEAEEIMAAEEAAGDAQATETTAAEATPVDGGGIAALLASADQQAGAKVSKKCAACHSFDNGGPNKVGPNLWDIVGKAVAGGEGYKYSGALADMGGDWSYESLDGFLAKPKDFAPGTKMSFAGLKSAEDRANLIAYLRSLSDNPKPLP
jgi:cytochrome c